jgi:PAS domain S-box-containing protein
MSKFNREELAQTLFEESGDALFLFDPDSDQLIDVNFTVQRLTGYTRQEMLRMTVSYLFRAEVPGHMKLLQQAFRKTGHFHSQEGFLLRCRRDGHWIPVNVTITRLHVRPKTLGLITARDVREQRQAHVELKNMEAELRRVLSSIPDGVWSIELDRDGKTIRTYTSPVVEKLLGRPPEYFSGGIQHWRNAIHPDDRSAFDEALVHLRAGSESAINYELRALWPNGEVRWLRNSVQAAPGLDGARHFHGVTTDVTERRSAEREKQRLVRLVESSADFIGLVTPNGTPIYINEAGRKLIGIDRLEDALDLGIDSFYPARLRRQVRTEILAQLLSGNGWQGDFELRHLQSEEPIAVHLSAFHIEGNGTDEPGCVAVVARDIRERKLAEEALQLSESKYRSLAENLEQCIFLKDTQLRFAAVNRQFCRSVELREEEVVGKTDFDFYPAELAENYRASDRQVLSEGKPIEVEEHSVIRGVTRDVRVIKTPVRDAQGNVTGVLGIFWDITEQRRLEAQLRQAQKMEAIGQLAGGIAHDFNNLLTVILGNIMLLRDACPDAPDGDYLATHRLQLLKETEQATHQAAALTSKLLGFSRRTNLRLEPTNLLSCAREAQALLRRTIDPRVEVEVRGPADLWNIRADPAQMNQVLMNLCLNARDAMPDGGRLTIETENVLVDPEHVRMHMEARPGEFVRLRVEDTGAGMPPEIRQHIFEPFFTTKEPGRGTGLGLAMVFGIVQQHQGWIECTSAPSEGTRFDVYFPHERAVPHTGKSSPVLALVGELDKRSFRGTETILLVDDEPLIRNLGRTILETYGYTVMLAEDGQQALDVFSNNSNAIDLVILDLTMPVLSGRDALRLLRQIDPEIPVLFASGYSAEQAIDADSEQVTGFVGKPFPPQQLASAVRQALDQAEKAAQRSPVGSIGLSTISS